MFSSTTSFVTATLALASFTQAFSLDHLIANRVEARAAAASSTPISFSFGVTIPTTADPEAGTAPYLSYGGYQFPLAKDARSGKLVSFFANFENSNPLNAQQTALNPNAPQNVTTSSSTTSNSGGPSTTNATIDANEARVVSTAFSSGNASSASAGAVPGGSSTSTSSSGNSNSTATANAAGLVSIVTNATVADASNAQSIQNINAAEGATSCAASASGAQSEADAITVVTIPVGDPSQHLSVVSAAYAACAAGLDAPSQSSGSSSSGSQASLAGVSSMVTCDGVTSSNQMTSTTFRVTVDGAYSKQSGFSGAVAGQRVAQSVSKC